jgi:hypothetical protein
LFRLRHNQNMKIKQGRKGTVSRSASSVEDPEIMCSGSAASSSTRQGNATLVEFVGALPALAAQMPPSTSTSTAAYPTVSDIMRGRHGDQGASAGGPARNRTRTSRSLFPF